MGVSTSRFAHVWSHIRYIEMSNFTPLKLWIAVARHNLPRDTTSSGCTFKLYDLERRFVCFMLTHQAPVSFYMNYKTVQKKLYRPISLQNKEVISFSNT